MEKRDDAKDEVLSPEEMKKIKGGVGRIPINPKTGEPYTIGPSGD